MSELAPKEPDPHHDSAADQTLIRYDREFNLWAEITQWYQLKDQEEIERYHVWASDIAKTGVALWWVRNATTNGVVIDYFVNDRPVGTILRRNDLGFVEAIKNSAGKVLRTSSLAEAVEWVEN